ncbi:MAG: helix-turn-helix domain-containing protein, partial [Gammaproteobacteria bacterium]
MDAEEARANGRRLKQIRKARDKTLVVVAELAGMSKSQLDRIERGEVALDRLSEIRALANALQIAPSELFRLPVPAPANGETDSAIETVRSAIRAVGRNRPGGQVLAVEVLRSRIEATLDAHYSCSQDGAVGAALPGLIRDLHTSIAAGRDVAQLLDLAVLLHAGATTGWLRVAGAPIDLRERAAELASRAAEARDTPAARGLATWGGLHVMLLDGAVDQAQAELNTLT